MAAATGMRRGLQSGSAEDGGWRVWMTSRWMAFRYWKRGGERVQNMEVILQQTVTDGGEVGWRRDMEKSRKRVKTGGAGGLE